MSLIETPTSPAGAQVRLTGPLNLQTIVAAHETLRQAISSHPHVTVALEAADDVDLTLVQLLVSARRTAHAAAGSLVLAAPAQGGLLEILRRGGFVETPAQRAFWLHSNEVPA